MTYERRRPEDSTLHRVVRENLKTFYAAAEDRHGGASQPWFVRKELEGDLDCGLLCRGFAVVACGACNERRLVAFGCHGRGFCPSCLGRRMAQTACNLLDHVLPRVPLRQWVLTLPHELRQRIAHDRELPASIGRIFVTSLLGSYRRKLRRVGIEDGKSGTADSLAILRKRKIKVHQVPGNIVNAERAAWATVTACPENQPEYDLFCRVTDSVRTWLDDGADTDDKR